jgi:hypothetical protein
MTGTNYTYYKLRHATDDKKECYIGSTKNMRNQISVHKNACKNENYKNVPGKGGSNSKQQAAPKP